MTTVSRPRVGTPEAVSGAGLRAFERYSVDWQAVLQCPDWSTAERIAAENVGRGGMFLRTDRELAVGARVEVTLKLPQLADVVLLGKVRHVQEAGVGVEVEAAYRNDLLALVEIARLRQGKPPLPVSEQPVGTTEHVAARPGVALPRGNACPIVGIDFGTGASGLAIAVDEAVYSVPDALGRVRIPSLVSYGTAPGQATVGWQALKLQWAKPQRTITGVKPLLGRAFSDLLVTHYLARTPVGGVSGPDDVLQFELGHSKVDVVQVSARIVRHLKEVLQPQAGIPIEQAVLAHPITFGAEQLAALKRAVQIAGVSVVELVPDALASARAMGFGGGETERIAVCNFGAGSFACTVIELGARAYRVLAFASDEELGGEDFDDQLATAVASALERRGGAKLAKGSVAWQQLRLRCERAKRRLATDEVAGIDLPPYDEAAPTRGGGAERQQVDRHAYQRICQPLLQRVGELCGGVLRDAGLPTGQLSHVVLTGGMVHLPFVRQTLERVFERQVAEQSRHDDLVALGAGLTAAQIVGHPAKEVRRLSAA